jgi:hypothetical protein
MRAVATITFLVAVATGCGGGVDVPPSSSSSTSSSGASSDPSPPASTSAPEPSGDSEGESLSPPAKVGDPPSPQTNGVPFHLVVVHDAPRHQPIEIDVAIDGTAVVRGSLSEGKTYTFDFTVASGAHTLDARAKHSMLETTETFALDAAGERWGVLHASAARCDPCAPATLTWEMKTAP